MRFKVTMFAFFLALFFVGYAEAKNERDYQLEKCTGLIEWRLPDNSRVDCLTHTHAIEFDYSNKWAEAIGQSLHYALMTKKRAGIFLILRGRSKEKHLKTLIRVIETFDLPIDVMTINGG